MITFYIVLSFLILTTGNSLVQLILTLNDERKLYKEKQESLPNYTYGYIIIPQVCFIIVGIICLFFLPIFNPTLTILLMYIIFVLSTGIGNLLVALLQNGKE